MLTSPRTVTCLFAFSSLAKLRPWAIYVCLDIHNTSTHKPEIGMQVKPVRSELHNKKKSTSMDPQTGQGRKKEPCRGAWTPEEDEKLVQVIQLHGPKRWKFLSAKAGLNRCGKSCRLRWLNYLRPNIKRGNISDQEEDLILRLHKLLGNRWSLIAGRLPGRTDNEIKNYWNSHLSKKISPMKQNNRGFKKDSTAEKATVISSDEEQGPKVVVEKSKPDFVEKHEELFIIPCGSEGPLNLEWMSKFLEMDEAGFGFADL